MRDERKKNGATTLRKTTFCITILSITTLNIMIANITTLGLMITQYQV